MNIKLEQVELLGKRILLKQEEKSDLVLASGIVGVSANAQEDVPIGIVASIGDQVTKFKVGDRVIFSTFSGKSIEFYMKVYLLMHEEEPIATIKSI